MCAHAGSAVTLPLLTTSALRFIHCNTCSWTLKGPRTQEPPAGKQLPRTRGSPRPSPFLARPPQRAAAPNAWLWPHLQDVVLLCAAPGSQQVLHGCGQKNPQPFQQLPGCEWARPHVCG